MIESKSFRLVEQEHSTKRGLQSVERALVLLTYLAQHPHPVGVNELARELKLAPSTVHRLLASLVGSGFAMRAPARRYRRGPSLLRLVGRPLAIPMRLREVARPELVHLAHENRETAHLAVLDGIDVVALDHVAAPRPLVARHPIGTRLPAHATAVGLAILAHVPEAVDVLLAGGLESLTDSTIVDGRSLSRALEFVRRQGYAVNLGGWHPETAGVAAPVLGEHGECLGAVGLSGPAARFGDTAILTKLGRSAVAASQVISADLRALSPEMPHFDGGTSAVASPMPPALRGSELGERIMGTSSIPARS